MILLLLFVVLSLNQPLFPLFSKKPAPAPKVINLSWNQQPTSDSSSQDIHPSMVAQYGTDLIEAETQKPYWQRLRSSAHAIATDQLNPCIETDPKYFLGITTQTESPYAPINAIEKAIKNLKTKIGQLTVKYEKNINPEQNKIWTTVIKQMEEALSNSGIKIYVARVIAEQLIFAATNKTDRLEKTTEEDTSATKTESELINFHKTTAGKLKVLKTLLSKLPQNGKQLYEVERCLNYYPDLIPEEPAISPNPYQAPFGTMFGMGPAYAWMPPYQQFAAYQQMATLVR
jgi:hypothetical protein